MAKGETVETADAVPAASLAGWLAFSTAGLFIFYQLNLQALPSVLREGLVVDFSLSNAGFGGLSASFFYPYMLLQIPSGLLVARLGSRRLLIAGLVLCILASFVAASSQSLDDIAAARILMGVGAAPAFVATMALVARWFPSRLFPILVALTETIGMLGAALGQEVLGFVVESAGWRAGLSLSGWFGIAVLAMTWLAVHDAPAGVARAAAAASPSMTDLLRLMLDPTLVLAGLVGGMIYSTGLAFAMLWGVPFFEKRLGVDLATASFCASFYSWGIIVGLPAFGWACGRVASPVVLLASGLVMTGAAVAVLLHAPPSLAVASLGMLLCGFAGGAYALAFVVVKSAVPVEASGAAFAFTNMLIIAVGGLILQPLIGVLADLRGGEATDPASLDILLWAQLVGLILLAPLAWRLRSLRQRSTSADRAKASG